MNDSDRKDFEDKIEIFSTDDERIKIIGEILSTESSRNILKMLFDEAKTANQLTQATQITLPVVLYHLKKMQEIGVVKVCRVEKSSREHDMKFYSANKFAILIVPPKVSEKAKGSKSLLSSLKKIYAFMSIGIAALIPWFVRGSIQHQLYSGVQYQKPITQGVPEDVFWSTIASLVIIIVGLIIVLILIVRKK
ncbi:MAG: ArsR family transcriptional regulator [Nitrosotalea sp.]